MLSRLIPLFIVALVGRSLSAADAPPTREAIEFFEKRIRPLLVESCYECHSAGAKKIKGELRVDGRHWLIKGGESGTSLVPGDPAGSRMIEAVTYKNADLQMPPKKKLSDAAIANLSQWVKMGAPWPPEEKTAPTTDTKPAVDFEARKREHWAWQPVKPHEPPKVKEESWPRNVIDRFILAKLEAKGLRPAPQADPRTLIRRAYFDLIGLPPTPQEVDEFVKAYAGWAPPTSADGAKKVGGAHPTIDPYEALIDRLLASPAYGERWARHWLDVVRYADSKDSRGQGGESDIPFAYRYRDWVIDAFNRDLPYDQFLMQQVAGDLMLQRHSNSASGSDQPSAISHQPFAPLIATSMLAIGAWETGDSDKRKMMTDIVDDQIDVVSRGFLGTTISCARCHDHKFDPITTRDYYALAGFFFSSHIIPGPGDPTNSSPMLRIPLLPREEVAAIQAAQKAADELKKRINEEIDARRKEVVTRELARIEQYLAAAAEFHRRDPSDESITLSRIAAKHSVHAEILGKINAYLGLSDSGGAIKGLFTTKLSEVLKSPRVNGWGSPDTPMVLAHTGDQPVKLLTFTLPPKSLTMHPSPAKHVAIGWRSPLSGKVMIAGKVADADGSCGNGFSWTITHRRGAAGSKLAGGAVVSGETRIISRDDNTPLPAVSVDEGDIISLTIDAREKNHFCDTTHFELVITELGGEKQTWDAAKDLVDSIHASNPHADSYGNRGVWHLYTVPADSAGGSESGVPAGSSLAQWIAIVADKKVSLTDDATRQRLAALVSAVRTSLTGDGKALNGPEQSVRAELTNIANSPVWSSIDLLPYSESDPTHLENLRSQLAEQSRIAARRIDYAHGVQEGGVPNSEHAKIRDARVHIRGRYDRLGEVVPRGFPALLTAKPQAAVTQGSGRLELARWLASKENPLTARVMVNRLWQHHFSRGLVATPDNFGHLGDRPSHPELLDHLAKEFAQRDWSIKAMHKLIMTSAAYQQASAASSAADAIDPDNRLLWRQNRRRLDAEQLRDAMLVAAGRIDAAQSHSPGPAVADLSAPRRTIYLMTVRSDTSNFRSLFDAADPTASIHQRSESTVAPQALFMLNHPFAQSMASALASRLIKEAPASIEARIAWLHSHLLSRPATPREIAIGERLVQPSGPSAEAERAAWTSYVQVLLSANEFMYVD